jgi:hypothetical protein
VFDHNSSEDDLRRAKNYTRAAWDTGYGETALPMELLFSYRNVSDPSKRTAAGKKLLKLTRGFDDNEVGSFVNAFGYLMNANLYVKIPEAHHIEISDYAMQIFYDNKDVFQELVGKMAGGAADSTGSQNMLTELEK